MLFILISLNNKKVGCPRLDNPTKRKKNNIMEKKKKNLCQYIYLY